uniref:TNF family profile domain-containing protein n=1 Tax=Terrapene triunguis TaxID=2587831 RepID=A0A674K0H7_9SAUR
MCDLHSSVLHSLISLLSLFLPMPTPHKIILFQEGLRDSHLHGFLFEKRINISWNRGTMNVRNLSIPIYCDGFYLVSLKGTIRAMPQRNASLSLKVYKRSDASILCVKVTEEVVDSVTVSEMRFKDEVYLEANRDANYKDLTLEDATENYQCLPQSQRNPGFSIYLIIFVYN